MTTVPPAIAEAVRLIEAHFASLEVGMRVALERTYTEAEVAEYVARTGIEYPGQHVSEDGEHLLPPGMLLVGPARTFGILDGPPLARGGLFTAATRRYRRPVRLGERVSYEAALADKFERGGYYYILMEWRAFDAEGREIGSGVEEHTLGSARKPRAS